MYHDGEKVQECDATAVEESDIARLQKKTKKANA